MKSDYLNYLLGLLILTVILYVSCGAATKKPKKKPMPPPKKVRMVKTHPDYLGQDRLGRDRLGEDRLGRDEIASKP